MCKLELVSNLQLPFREPATVDARDAGLRPGSSQGSLHLRSAQVVIHSPNRLAAWFLSPRLQLINH